MRISSSSRRLPTTLYAYAYAAGRQSTLCRAQLPHCGQLALVRALDCCAPKLSPLTRRFHSSIFPFAVTPFKLADIGEGIFEVELLAWHVKVGDKVNEFDKLCEVQSDKATVEITSRYSGIIRTLNFKAGDMVKVGTALLDIETSAENYLQPPLPSSPPPSLTPSLGAPKQIPFLLADIGEGIFEVELVSWFVKVGDQIKQFDKVCEVQSDKATVEITSRYDGTVTQIHHEPGAMVKVGSALLHIDVSRGAEPMTIVTTLPKHTATQWTTDVTGMPPPGNGGRIITTPAVRRLAKEYGIELSQVTPTGPKGRVLKDDVMRFIQSTGASFTPRKLQRTVSNAGPAHTIQRGPPEPPPISADVAVPGPMLVSPPKPVVGVFTGQRVPIKGIQRQMVRSMKASLQVPHFGYNEEIYVDKLAKLREELKPIAEKSGCKLSFMPIIVKAASLALTEYPILNSSVSADESEMIYHSSHNIGVAMDTPKGLLVPNIKDVSSKSIIQLAQELQALQAIAAKGALAEQHLTGGTFTLSNIGSIGGTYASPVIMLPQVAIGALGKFQIVPRFVTPTGEVLTDMKDYSGQCVCTPVRVMFVSWSGDHRVIDGATIARFSNLFKSFLEEPSLMLGHTR